MKAGGFGESQLFDPAYEHPERVKELVEWMDNHREPRDRFLLKGLDAVSGS